MKEYVKTVLYVYPLLKTLGKEYQEHIVNRAVLSYRMSRSVESEVEYLVQEIADKRNLAWLKTCVESVLAQLSDEEKTLIAVRYFGKERTIKKATVAKAVGQNGRRGAMSESTYFRKQNRLLNKVGELLGAVGVDEKTFEALFARLPLFQKVAALQVRRESKLSKNERQWFA